MSSSANEFLRWNLAAELQLQFISTLAAYKKQAASAALHDAVATNELERVRALTFTIKELDRSMSQLRHFEGKVRRKIEQIENRASGAAMIRHGHTLSKDLYSRVWIGFNYFYKQCPQKVVDSLNSTEIMQAARPGANFALVGSPVAICDDVPDDVTNVDGLLVWLQEHRYLPRRGKPAYLQITQAFSAVASAVNEQIAELENSIERMQKGTYDAWKPVILSSLVPDESAAQITSASPFEQSTRPNTMPLDDIDDKVVGTDQAGWTDEKATRRAELVEKKYRSSLTDLERKELDDLQLAFGKYQDRVSPFFY